LLQEERSKLKDLAFFNFGMPKPTLWNKGGHPFVPSSGAVFRKIQETLTFVDYHWSGKGFLKLNCIGIIEYLNYLNLISSCALHFIW
jgi:hypothetical protein